MSEQLSIDYNAERSVRASDPVTSYKAAVNAARFASSHAGRILQALKTHGPRSAHELEQLVGLSVVQIDRRLPDLKAAKLARVQQLDDDADVVRNNCRVWEAL